LGLVAGVLLAGSLGGCKYLLVVDTTDATIFFAFSSGPGHGDRDGDATVRIVNAQESAVRTLAVAKGTSAEVGLRVAWDLRDDAGRRVPAGSYGARLLVDGEVVEEAAPVHVSST
jgi:hypothetical protein